MAPKWGRVLLKLSGEAFAGEAGNSIDGATVTRLANEIVEARSELGVEMAVVVGGGNIWRGATGANSGIDRATADYMGMLATVMNSLALADKTPSKRPAINVGCRAPSTWPKLLSRTSDAERYATWRRGEW